MTLFYDTAYALGLLLAAPWLMLRRLRRGPGSLALTERLGRTPSRPVATACVWIHGVSLGEINATRTIVTELRRRAPHVVVVISSTTRTGLDRARELYPGNVVFRFPLDFSFAVRRVLNTLRPSLIVLMELEVWPNLLEIASRRNIPVIIANGRATDEKSVRRFQWPVLRMVAQRMFRQLSWVGAQDEQYAERFRVLGAPPEKIEVTGSVKYDAADVSDRIEGQDALRDAMGMDPDAPLWVCGSTGPGEESLILDAYQTLLIEFPQLQLAIIPRRPERFDEVARLIVERGFACLRRSTGAPLVPAAGGEPRPVFLGDTMGELRKFYALAAVVFVGRTLTPLGGSDLMEAAGLAKALIAGPHTENFAEATELLCAAGGVRIVRDGTELAEAVAGLLRDPNQRAHMGQAARETILQHRGATERTVQRILRFLF